MKIEVNKIMNPAFLLGTAFNIAYWHRKYHSGTICKGVSNPQTSNAFTGCEKEEIPKCVPRRYRQRIRMKLKKSFIKMKGKNGILLFVFNLKGLLEEYFYFMFTNFLTLRLDFRKRNSIMKKLMMK